MFKYVLLFALIAVAACNEDAKVIEEKSDVRADGFDSVSVLDNGVKEVASGDEHGNIHGSYEWISPEGEHVAVSYVADENGYQPKGDVLPTPHPIPEAILKSIEYLRTHAPKSEHAH